MSPTPFTLVSASFQGWLEPNHLFQICSPSGFLVHQPVSLTKEGRNVSNLPFPQSSWIAKKLNSTNLEIFHHKWASFISQFIPVYGCYSVQDKPCRPWRLVCHPLGSQSKPARVPPPGGSYQGLALGFKWLPQLSPLDTCGKLSNANFGLFLPHQRAEESPWLTSSILLGLKWERLSQSFVCISPETVRIWLGLCLFFFLSCSPAGSFSQLSLVLLMVYCCSSLLLC